MPHSEMQLRLLWGLPRSCKVTQFHLGHLQSTDRLCFYRRTSYCTDFSMFNATHLWFYLDDNVLIASWFDSVESASRAGMFIPCRYVWPTG